MTQGAQFVGLVTSHKRTSGGGKGIGRFWGNCPKLSMAFNPNTIERNESMTTSRAPLRRSTRSTEATITLVTDEFNKKNFADSTSGRIDEVAADAATTINVIFPTGALVGDVLAVPQTNINTQVITDSTGAPKTLVLGTNYTQDLFTGHITLIDLSTGGPYVQPFKSAHKQGAVTVIAGLAIASTEIWVCLAGTNADNGERGVLDTYRVRLDPSKVFEFINSDYNDMEIGGAALLDLTKTASAIGGQIFKFSLPATHE